MLLRMLSLLVLASMSVGCSDESEVATPEVFDTTVLHEVDIRVDSAYLPQLAIDMDNRVPCTFVYDGEELRNVGIRQKGNTAIDLNGKPSFSLRFDEFDDKADLHGLNKILLNNSEQDPTFSRPSIGASLHQRAGLVAERVAHAHVTFNGVDKGTFVVVEAIDKDFLRLHFGETNDEGNLYEGPCCGDFANDVNYMVLEDEKKDNRSRDDLQALIDVILNEPDATFASAINQRLDLNQFIKIYALEALLGHWDGFAFRGNNYYMYDNPVDHRFVFFPHGMDRVLDAPTFDMEQSPVTKLAQRIRANADLDAQLHSEITQMSSSVWDAAAIRAVINQTGTLVHAAGSGAQSTQDAATFDANVVELRNIVTIRTAAMNP